MSSLLPLHVLSEQADSFTVCILLKIALILHPSAKTSILADHNRDSWQWQGSKSEQASRCSEGLERAGCIEGRQEAFSVVTSANLRAGGHLQG